MTSLLIESLANTIPNGGILEDNSTAKQIIQIFSEGKIDKINKLYSLRNNLNFSEIGTDLLTKIENTSGAVYSLTKRGYQKTTFENYNFENFNHILSSEKIPVIEKNEKIFIDSIALNGKEKRKEYLFFHQDDYIIFIPSESNSSVEYFYKLNNYKILDLKIDNSFFVYLLVEKDNKQLFVTTHLGKCFCQYNDDHSTLNLKECYNCVDVSSLNLKSLEYIDSDYYFLCNDFSKLKISFCKKYFFEYDNFLYFNNQGDVDEFENDFLETVQNDALNMYNYLNIYGLNDFTIKNRKISSHENELFLELLKNKFDNTLNGGLNYFNAKGIDGPEISQKIKELYNAKKDYHININDEYYQIYGNFIYKNFKHGQFEIHITKDEARLIEITDNTKKLVEKIKFYDFKEFYFCNLKFMFKKFEFPNKILKYSISSFSSYPFKQKFVKNFKLKALPNNPVAIDNIIKNSQIKKTNGNAFFDGKKIVFQNFFDWNKKRYQYGNTIKNLQSQEIVDMDNIKMFTTMISHQNKNNKLYAREEGKLYYSNVDAFTFELIDKNGYITNFWVKNQDKVVYFKNENNQVKIIDNKFESDFYCYIPSISNYIRFNKNQYSNISVDISDNLEVPLKYNENLLITNQFLNKPLFYKVYIPNCNEEDAKVFDDSDNEIIEYIKVKYNDGIIFYFNTENDRKYYYNTQDSKFNYFEPLESYKNINLVYPFDETGYINLPSVKTINSFSLKSTELIEKDITITLIMYNTFDGTVNKISLNKNDLNYRFEIDLNVNKIYIDVENNLYPKDSFELIEDSNDSMVFGNQLIFFKKTRQDIVYISKKRIKIPIEKIPFSSLKVDTYYNFNEKFIEDPKGDYIIDSLNSNEIAIIQNISNLNDYITTNVFLTESISDNDDDFYKKNFKTAGNFYINYNINSDKIAETFNEYVDSSEIFK